MYKFISDLHFGHRSIITKCNRPFQSVEEMNTTMINNINEATDRDDILMILGDVACYGYNPAQDLEAIHCRKVLIIGNHDRSLLSHHSFRKQFLDIRENELLNDHGFRLFLAHFPHAEWDGYWTGRYHFYGHIHNSTVGAALIMAQYTNAANVSADVLGFSPKSAAELIQKAETIDEIKQLGI